MPEVKDRIVVEEEFDIYDTGHWLELFQRINRECSIMGDPIHLFSDTDYYTEQVHILMDERNYELARCVALGLARM